MSLFLAWRLVLEGLRIEGVELSDWWTRILRRIHREQVGVAEGVAWWQTRERIMGIPRELAGLLELFLGPPLPCLAEPDDHRRVLRLIRVVQLAAPVFQLGRAQAVKVRVGSEVVGRAQVP